MSDTREKILQAALALFARDGFEAVSVSQIAGALGMTKGALYKHYENKRDIFDSIVARMEAQDASRAEAFSLPEGTVAEMAEKYRRASVAQIVEYSKAQFRYWTEDGFAADFRRMLTLEQYRSDELGALYQQYLAAGPLAYLTDLLGSLGFSQPAERAAELYAPMFLLFSVCDGTADRTALSALADRLLDAAGARLLANLAQN